MKIKIFNKEYNVVKDNGETLNDINLEEFITDYYDSFDYIVGDWAYSKLRLKGFYKHDNKLRKEYNDYNNVDKYINDNCAYGCKYFILEKLVEKQK